MSITTHGTYARLELDTANPSSQLADEIARFVLKLEASEVAHGLAGMVRTRLRAGMDERGQAFAERIKTLEGAPKIKARRIEPAELPGMWEASDLYGGEADGYHRP